MPAIIRTSLDKVVLAIQAQLMAFLSFPVERVPLNDPDNIAIPPEQAEQLVFVWPDLETSKLYPGDGRWDTRDEVTFAVEVLNRVSLDEEETLQVWATDTSLGHLPLRHKVLQALVGFWPPAVFGVDGDVLTEAPLVPGQLSRPRPEKKQPGWGRSRFGVRGTYILDLPQTTAAIPNSGGIP